MAVIRDTRDLGALVRRARKARGYTQAGLAELAGVGVVYVSQLENGKETAEVGKALSLLRLLGVGLEATDRGAEEAPSASPAGAPGAADPGEAPADAGPGAMFAAYELFGEMRASTPEEAELHGRMLRRAGRPFGENLLDS